MGIFAEIINLLRELVTVGQSLLREMKGFRMDFTALSTVITKLSSDVSAEVQAALAAIAAAKAGDQSQLDAAVASLQAIDGAVTAAKDAFPTA